MNIQNEEALASAESTIIGDPHIIGMRAIKWLRKVGLTRETFVKSLIMAGNCPGILKKNIKVHVIN